MMLDARQRTNLGRILREGLTNAIKHAQPSRLCIRFIHNERGITLTIDDDGTKGDQDWAPGRGTRVVRTRAADLGGTAQWEPSKLGGTALRVEVPLPAVAAKAG